MIENKTHTQSDTETRETNQMNKTLPILASISLAIGACAPMQTDPYGNPIGGQYGGGSMIAPAAGALGGGAVSGLACSALGRGNGKTAIVGACTLLGGIAGLVMGQQYSQQQRVTQAYQNPRVPMMAQPQAPYQQQPYQGDAELKLGKTFSDPSTGEYCREFQHRAKVGGKIQQLFGTACQQPDGTWKVIS
jgi:surface antigen